MHDIKFGIIKDDGLGIKGLGREEILRLGGRVGLVDRDKIKVSDVSNFAALA